MARRGFRDPRREQTNLFARALGQAEPAPAAAGEEPAAAERPATVSEITREVKELLEGRVGRVWVEGEVSNLSRPRSGHLYFTLKDEHAAIGCVMWRSSARRLRTEVADGLRVSVRGAVSVYEPQGRYQIVCDSLRPFGVGELQRRYEELVARLEAEELFAAVHKQPLPAYPRTVGLVTSPTGAAVRDMIRILRRRLPGVRIILSPCRVQGEAATPEIVAALQRLDRSGLADLILIGRGGGSLEDLWCFNEEAVARAVFACRTPIVSAVGHETDLTICDLVADLRAATPSEAAEAAVPAAEAVRADLAARARRLRQALRGRLEVARLRVRELAGRPVLRDPRGPLLLRMRHVDETTERLARSAGGALRRAGLELRHAARRLSARYPLALLRRKRERLGAAALGLRRGLAANLRRRAAALAAAAGRLEALSPLAVLGRGYSLTWDAAKRTLVRSVRDVRMGATLETRLRDGVVRSTVTGVEEQDQA
jgi:exodeoxyribonuclease VII large subunit